MEQRVNYPWEIPAEEARAMPYPEPLAEAYAMPARGPRAAPRLPPAAPTLLTAHAIGGDRVTMHWTKVPLVDGYLLLRGASGGTMHPLAALEENTYTDTRLRPGETYYYAVRSYNANGQSVGAASASVSLPLLESIQPTEGYYPQAAPQPFAQTPLPTPEESPEPTPESQIIPMADAARPTSAPQAVACGTRLISLEWAECPEAEGYRLYRSLAPWSSYSLCAETNETRFLDAVDAPETRYYYFVQAVSGGKSSAPSPMAEAVTLPALPEPQQPQRLRAAVTGRDTIELRWDRAVGAAAYLICARSNPGEEFHPIGQAPETVFVHRELPPDSWIEYCVQGYHDSGISQPSLIVSARTPKQQPPRSNRPQGPGPGGFGMPRFPAFSLNAFRQFAPQPPKE